MKTKILLLFLATMALRHKDLAQCVFTNTMVFNYSVNDTFVYKNNEGNILTLKVITSKNFSANGDTVKYGTYNFQSVISTGPWGVQTTTTASNSTEFFSHLNDTLKPSPAIDFPGASMYSLQGGTYIDPQNCGILTYSGASYPIVYVGEPSNWQCKYAVGLGRTHYYQYVAIGAPPVGWGIDLVYFHKAGSAPCGNRPALPVGISANTIDRATFEIYPNPIADVLYIKSFSAVRQIRVSDLAGRSFHISVDGNKADLAALQPGVYFITETNNLPVPVKKIIKTD